MKKLLALLVSSATLVAVPVSAQSFSLDLVDVVATQEDGVSIVCNVYVQGVLCMSEGGLAAYSDGKRKLFGNWEYDKRTDTLDVCVSSESDEGFCVFVPVP